MEAALAKIPGPGAYNSSPDYIDKVKTKAPGYSMGARIDPKLSVVPGPGSYNSSTNLLKANVKSNWEREGPRKIAVYDGRGKDVPPPGQYDVGLPPINAVGRSSSVNSAATNQKS